MIKYPTIILGGAPKCGTSSLFNWLIQHPNISGSNPKETFYIMDEENPLSNTILNVHNDKWQNYSTFYKTSGKQMLLEATTHVIYQKTAPFILNNLPTIPSIIFVLRNPVDRFFSSFVYSKNNLASIPANLSFDKVAKAQLYGDFKPLSENPSGYVVGQDLLLGNYAKYIAHWLNLYPNGKVGIFFFEELIKSPEMFLKEVLEFIGQSLPEDQIDFSSKNKTKTVKNKQLHSKLRSIASYFPNGKFTKTVKELYFRLQKGQPETISCEIKAELSNYYKDSNQELSELIGKKLPW
ncbi:MAG TPA: sulfotransferase domain-containing protein [Fulvivirga sp.]|nr:sulfotransferase domain-containing protein [Fulvivirga sp.]